MIHYRKGRILAFQTLYSWEMVSYAVEEPYLFRWDEKPPSTMVRNYAHLLVEGVINSIDLVDNKIKEHSTNWDFDKISKVDLAILRLAIYELLFRKDVPKEIIMDEAVEIAKKFSNYNSSKFINGVLAGVVQSEPF